MNTKKTTAFSSLQSKNGEPMINLRDSKSDNLTGHFLIAMPGLQDDNFHQTVTLICEHNDEGAMGITLNRKSHFLMAELFNELNIDSSHQNPAILYEGGPMQPESGFILHRYEEGREWENTTRVNDEICLTTSKDIIESIANDDGPKDFHISLGYAGWSTEQLTGEIVDNSWLTTPASADKIFNTPSEDIWLTSAQWIGINMSQLSPTVGRA